jgi:hypothetical protein
MPCFFSNASCNFSAPPANGWVHGGGPDLCGVHYQELANEITKNGALPFPVALLNDYVKISVLMRDEATVLNQLSRLNTDMAAGGALDAGDRQLADSGDRTYVKLSDALEYFEKKCWFPSVRMVLVGLLPGDDFLRLLRSGIPVKDVGAGANHGEFSHRLQWFAIMRIATNDFSRAKAPGWNTSPYDLYCSFGEGVALQRNLWGVLLDKQGAGDSRDPSRLDDRIRNSGVLPNLNRKLTHVRTKRFDMTNRVSDFAVRQADKEVVKKPSGAPAKLQAKTKLGDNYASQLTGAYYTMYRNISIDGVKIRSQVADVVAQNSDPSLPDHKRLAAADFDGAAAMPATPAIGILKEMELYRKPNKALGGQFSVVMDHGALLRTGDALPTDREVQMRRIRSRVSLHS